MSPRKPPSPPGHDVGRRVDRVPGRGRAGVHRAHGVGQRLSNHRSGGLCLGRSSHPGAGQGGDPPPGFPDDLRSSGRLARSGRSGAGSPRGSDRPGDGGSYLQPGPPPGGRHARQRPADRSPHSQPAVVSGGSGPRRDPLWSRLLGARSGCLRRRHQPGDASTAGQTHRREQPLGKLAG